MKKKILMCIVMTIIITTVIMATIGCSPQTPDKILKTLGDGTNYSIKMTLTSGEYEFVANEGKYYSKMDNIGRYYIPRESDKLMQVYSMIDGNWSMAQDTADDTSATDMLNKHINYVQPFINKLKEFSTNIEDYRIDKNVWQHKIDSSYLEVIDNRLQVILLDSGKINNKSAFSYGVPKQIVLPAAASRVSAA